MKYLIRVKTESENNKLKYVIKSMLQKVNCFEIKKYEKDEKFEDENQLTLFASNIKKSLTINEVSQ